MGLDDIERLLRNPERMVSPVERECFAVLCHAGALSDATAEDLLASLVAEDGDPHVRREPAALGREQLDVLEASLSEMTASDGPRRALAMRLLPRLSTKR